jgi:hypothetical protein
MHYLAKLTPRDEAATNKRLLVCLGCSRLIHEAVGLTNEEARRLTVAHYNRKDLTHSAGPDLGAEDVVIAPINDVTADRFPLSLIFTLRGAA